MMPTLGTFYPRRRSQLRSRWTREGKYKTHGLHSVSPSSERSRPRTDRIPSPSPLIWHLHLRTMDPGVRCELPGGQLVEEHLTYLFQTARNLIVEAPSAVFITSAGYHLGNALPFDRPPT